MSPHVRPTIWHYRVAFLIISYISNWTSFYGMETKKLFPKSSFLIITMLMAYEACDALTYLREDLIRTGKSTPTRSIPYNFSDNIRENPLSQPCRGGSSGTLPPPPTAGSEGLHQRSPLSSWGARRGSHGSTWSLTISRLLRRGSCREDWRRRSSCHGEGWRTAAHHLSWVSLPASRERHQTPNLPK